MKALLLYDGWFLPKMSSLRLSVLVCQRTSYKLIAGGRSSIVHRSKFVFESKRVKIFNTFVTQLLQ